MCPGRLLWPILSWWPGFCHRNALTDASSSVCTVGVTPVAVKQPEMNLNSSVMNVTFKTWSAHYPHNSWSTAPQPPRVNLPYDWLLVYDVSSLRAVPRCDLRAPPSAVDAVREPSGRSCYLKLLSFYLSVPTSENESRQLDVKLPFVPPSAVLLRLVWFLLSVSLELRCRSLMVQKYWQRIVQKQFAVITRFIPSVVQTFWWIISDFSLKLICKYRHKFSGFSFLNYKLCFSFSNI